MAAASAGKPHTTELLLNFDADPNAKGADGKTVLMLAESGGHADVAAMLKKHTAKSCDYCGQATAS